MPLLNDSLALEGEEVFRLTLELVGSVVDEDGGISLDNGRAIAVPGLKEAQVAILDQNGKEILGFL